MAIDNIKKSGTKPEFKDDRGGGVLIPHPVIGIVKDNIDPTHSGRIKVYVGTFPSNDPNNSKTWLTVKYLSPFFGSIAPGYDVYEGKDKTGYGSFKGNPHSYGFWGTAPDIGSEVLCIFVNGNPQDGYYLGCIPIPGLNHMVPAIAATKYVVPNSGEATSLGGADRLPVTEVNYANPSIRNSGNWYPIPKPIHSYQANILFKQGLIRDNLRGVISSSAQRETPSKVFGISTPGGPIYEGGYTNLTIGKSLSKENTAKLQVVGRTGGHSLVMDDGTLEGQDQLVRLRTAGGHMIMMNDTGQVMTVMHSNGLSFIEFGKEGTIDMYSANSVNVRTQGDLNFHADRDINMHAKRNINMFANNIAVESDQNYTLRTGKDYLQYTLGKFTLKVDQQMSLFSLGNSSFASDAITYINGKKINLNTGRTSTIPQAVNIIPKINHIDTTFSQTVGWMNPSPEPLLSVASRAPAHMPWAAANKGVDVKIDNVQPVTQPQPSPTVQATTNAAGAAPETTTNPTVAATAPTQNASVPNNATVNVPTSTATTMASQQAVVAAATTAQEKIDKGIIPGTAGVTFTQMSAAGQAMKPGSGDFAKQLHQLAPDLPLNKLATPMLMTGQYGVTNGKDLVSNTTAQLGAFTNSLQTANSALTNLGVISGKESVTQVAGVMMAAAITGAGPVVSALQSGQGLNSTLANSDVGKAIAAGTYAASLADKVSSGLSGVTTSLSSMAGNVLNSVSSGITSALSQVSGGIGALAGSLAGAAKTAYAVAEKSFGKLTAGKPNVLGGQASEAEVKQSEVLNNVTQIEVAQADLVQAQKDLVQISKEYRETQSPELYLELKSVENRVADAEQKLAQIKQSALNNVNPVNPISAQAASTIASASASGQLNAPNTQNTGINALPGGIGAFVNVVGSTASNFISGVKNVASTAITALQNPASLVGNLTTNFKNSLQNSVSNVTQNISGITNIVNNGKNVASSIIGSASNTVSGIVSNVSTQLSSLGNAPGQIKQAVLAENTFTGNAAINSKMASIMGDPSIPLPVFEEITTQLDNEKYQKAQVAAQTALKDLFASRELLSLQQNNLIDSYASTQNIALLTDITSINNQIQEVDKQIVAAQANYDRILKTG